MTPKEKAKELVDKLLVLQEKIEWGNNKLKTEAGLIYEKNNLEYNKYYDELAKQSALIAVDEILKITCLKDFDYKKYFNDNSEFINYWQEVKQEIEKL